MELHRLLRLPVDDVNARKLSGLGSKIRLCTTLNGRTVSFPVSMAAGRVEFTLLK